jgi:hypothetical protein
MMMSISIWGDPNAAGRGLGRTEGDQFDYRARWIAGFSTLAFGGWTSPGQMDAAAYVLQTFHKSEQELLAEFLQRAADAVSCFIEYDLDTAMNRFNPNQSNKE